MLYIVACKVKVGLHIFPLRCSAVSGSQLSQSGPIAENLLNSMKVCRQINEGAGCGARLFLKIFRIGIHEMLYCLQTLRKGSWRCAAQCSPKDTQGAFSRNKCDNYQHPDDLYQRNDFWPRELLIFTQFVRLWCHFQFHQFFHKLLFLSEHQSNHVLELPAVQDFYFR